MKLAAELRVRLSTLCAALPLTISAAATPTSISKLGIVSYSRGISFCSDCSPPALQAWSRPVTSVARAPTYSHLRLFQLVAGAEVITAPTAFPASESSAERRFLALPVFGCGSRFIQKLHESCQFVGGWAHLRRSSFVAAATSRVISRPKEKLRVQEIGAGRSSQPYTRIWAAPTTPFGILDDPQGRIEREMT